MPQLLEQIDGLSVAEKREVLTYLIRYVTFEVPPRAKPSPINKRIGLMEGKWHLPDEETDRRMDAEIEQMFEQAARHRKAEDSALAQWDRLVLAGKERRKKPYRFSRSDAYDGQLYCGMKAVNPFKAKRI